MNESGALLTELAKLPRLTPPLRLSAQIRERAQKALAPVPLHPAWSIAAAASVVVYLGWALLLTRPF
jgi:hypothetical protein